MFQKEQQKDKMFLEAIKKSKAEYDIKIYQGADKNRSLICQEGKTTITLLLQKGVLDWYHTALCHPGAKHTELTIHQHFKLKKLPDGIRTLCHRCLICHRTKQQYTKHGCLLEKQPNKQPWETLCVDLIGLYHISQGTGSTKIMIVLYCVTMVDPATCWFDIEETTMKSSNVVTNIVEQTWLTRYPWSHKVILVKGMELMKGFITLVQDEYRIKCKPITTRNPQVNVVLERSH
eukprot:1077663-Ditylum_brightwellii.AAC.1